MGRRLLPTAVTVLTVAAVAVCTAPADAGSTHSATVVAPYVDMGEHAYGLLDRAIARHDLRWFSAGFVIGHGCQAVWDDGDRITAAPAPTKALAEARSLGAKVIVSFGGAGGKDLARSCTDPTRLLAAYRSVVTQVKPAAIDFDIEGKALESQSSIRRRFAAIHGLELGDPALPVSLTVPVEPTGLDGAGRALLRVAVKDQVRVDLVNIMTMDFGGKSIDMGAAALSAARDTLAQLRKLWPADTYANLGITPMIGINDNRHETFTVADARRVAAFARSHEVGRLAFWAIERDQPCPHAAHRARDTCSSLTAPTLAFTTAFLAP